MKRKVLIWVSTCLLTGLSLGFIIASALFALDHEYTLAWGFIVPFGPAIAGAYGFFFKYYAPRKG